MPTTEARPRVSAYQARIERQLTDVYFEVPTERQAGREWKLTHVAHTNGYAQCELCGHFPIRRLFFIRYDGMRVRGGAPRELMIGSECARNYLTVDLVEAWERNLTREQNRLRREERRARTVERNARARGAAQATWEFQLSAAHQENLRWLAQNHEPSGRSTFLASVWEQYSRGRRLTPAQLDAVGRFRERALSGAVRPLNARDRAAGPDDVPHIYNGNYTVTNTDTAEHMTFQIRTSLRGPLEGTRIVKVMRRYERFEGFAFVGRDGDLVLWRRFQSDRDQPYAVWARHLLNLLNEREADAEGIEVIEHGAWRIERTRLCRRCNRQLTTPTSIHLGIGPECQRRTTEETTAAAQVVREPDVTAVVTAAFHPVEGLVSGPVRYIDRTPEDIALSISVAPSDDGVTFGEPMTLRPRPAPEARRPQRRARLVSEGVEQLTLSQLGTGEVL